MAKIDYTPKPCKNCGSTDRTPSGNCRPCGRRKSKEWYEQNREKHRKYHREYSRKNRSKLNANRRQQYHSNPVVKQKQFEANKSYVYSKRAPGSFTPEQWETILNKYDHKCISCGCSNITLSIDHIIPISKGGTNNPDNLQPLCISCNAAKGDSIVDYRPDSDNQSSIQLKLFDSSQT